MGPAVVLRRGGQGGQSPCLLGKAIPDSDWGWVGGDKDENPEELRAPTQEQQRGLWWTVSPAELGEAEEGPFGR